MTLALADIRDPDCVASLSPLSFDSLGAYVTGATAILRRVLYAITSPRSSLVYAPAAPTCDVRDLENASLDARGIEGWRNAVLRAARAVDFVLDASASLSLVARAWIVTVAVRLVDGKTYTLEVGISDAGTAINSLGSVTS